MRAEPERTYKAVLTPAVHATASRNAAIIHASPTGQNLPAHGPKISTAKHVLPAALAFQSRSSTRALAISPIDVMTMSARASMNRSTFSGRFA